MRNAYEPPPWLAPLNTPAVSATTGLGTGGGASVQTPDSGGFGDINVRVGPGFSQAGSVALTFPQTPPTLFVSGDENFVGLTQATVGNVVTLSWTSFNFKSPGPNNGRVFRLHYEWAVSK